MKDCIEREPLLAWLSNMEVSENITKVIADPERFPSANIKHGTWAHCSRQHGNETEGIWTERFLKCSACGYERRHAWLRGEQPNFCENCGADMREVAQP